MQILKLTAMCPECEEDMVINCGDFTGNNPIEVDITQFEQAEFICKKCNKTYYTGDIDLLSEDDI